MRIATLRSLIIHHAQQADGRIELKHFIRALSPRAEFLVVLFGAFGYFILGSVLAFANPGPTPPISNGHLLFLLIFESLVLLVLGSFLSVRGRPLHRLGVTPTLRGTAEGVGLAVAAYAAYATVFLIAALILPSDSGLIAQGPPIAPGLSIVLIVAVAIVNPAFEELFVCGYIIAALRERRSFWTAVNVSIAVRLSYHLYQGTLGIISIIPLGFVFAYWYARTGRLWPVMIAHALFDFAALFLGSRY